MDKGQPQHISSNFPRCFAAPRKIPKTLNTPNQLLKCLKKNDSKEIFGALVLTHASAIGLASLSDARCLKDPSHPRPYPELVSHR